MWESEQGLTLFLKGGVRSGIRYLLNSDRSDDVQEAKPSSLAGAEVSSVHTASLTRWLCRTGRGLLSQLDMARSAWHGQRKTQELWGRLLHVRLHSVHVLFPCFYMVFFSGIESMRAGHSRIAYTCFKLAADRGYSKAQFNVGLCYEHGRGTEKDLEKAALYYYHAASSRHPMAQYRYARYLLRHRPENEWDRHQKAVTFLEQAAMAGVTEAQAYLGVFYMRGLQPKEKRGLKYLLLAARNGDAQSRYHVGVCYEKGLGVQQNLAEAMRHYQQSAAAGNRNARERLRVLQEEVEGTRGSHQTTQPRQSTLTLPHSWSADGLHMMMLSGAGWSHALGNRTRPLELQCLEPHHCCY
uniref:DAP3 binding cell death enhancer 1 n=1 Tax=Strigops habroptila TaxID=2489341 RepID=A0A672UJ59_STRHB